MRPRLFDIQIGESFSIAPSSYGAFLLLGVFCAALLIILRTRTLGVKRLGILAVVAFSLGVGVLGAAAFGLGFSQFDNVAGRSASPYSFTLVWQGGVLCGVFAAAGMLRYLEYPVVRFLDLAISPAFVGLVWGRIGCLFAGCCYGKPTALPWGFHYPEAHSCSQAYGNLPVHPVPIYSMILATLISISGFFFFKKKPRGFVLTWSLTIYSMGRFVLEMARGDHSTPVAGLSVQQALCVLTALAVISWYLLYKRPSVWIEKSESPS